MPQNKKKKSAKKKPVFEETDFIFPKLAKKKVLDFKKLIAEPSSAIFGDRNLQYDFSLPEPDVDMIEVVEVPAQVQNADNTTMPKANGFDSIRHLLDVPKKKNKK